MVKRLLEMDRAMILGLQRLRAPQMTWLMRLCTRLGDASTWAYLCLFLIAAGRATEHLGLRVGLAAGMGALFSQLLKRLCRRARPSSGMRGFCALIENPDQFSFPSGHTTAAVAVAIAVAGQSQHLDPLVLTLTVGIGVSRVYLGAHYPLDVIAGGFLGGAVGAVFRIVSHCLQWLA